MSDQVTEFLKLALPQLEGRDELSEDIYDLPTLYLDIGDEEDFDDLRNKIDDVVSNYKQMEVGIAELEAYARLGLLAALHLVKKYEPELLVYLKLKGDMDDRH